MLGMPGGKNDPEKALAIIRSKYGRGDRRSLEQAIKFSGIDTVNVVTTFNGCGNLDFVPFIEHPNGPDYVPKFDEITEAPLDEPDPGSIYYKQNQNKLDTSKVIENKIDISTAASTIPPPVNDHIFVTEDKNENVIPPHQDIQIENSIIPSQGISSLSSPEEESIQNIILQHHEEIPSVDSIPIITENNLNISPKVSKKGTYSIRKRLSSKLSEDFELILGIQQILRVGFEYSKII